MFALLNSLYIVCVEIGKTQRTLKFKSLKVKDYKPTTYIKKQIKVEIKEEPVDYKEEPYD